jgi:hypothetical protein
MWRQRRWRMSSGSPFPRYSSAVQTPSVGRRPPVSAWHTLPVHRDWSHRTPE